LLPDTDRLRVLQVNKFFRPGAGAETSFFQTRDLLRRRGHDVIDFAMRHPSNLPSPYEGYFAPERSYDGEGRAITRVRDATLSIYSVPARKRLARLLAEHRPDVAHLHNVYHQLTLSVVDELAAQRVPMVMTLHDWKVACPAYTLFTEGAPCRRCPTNGFASAVRHRCVKGSAAASAFAALEAAVVRQRRTYSKINRFIGPSRFAVEVAQLGGLDVDRVEHVPNFLPDDELRPELEPGEVEPRILYVGRLDVTKGVRELLDAFSLVTVDAQLRIVGAGALEPEVREAAARDTRISYLGRLDRERVFEEYARALCVTMPSVWEDNGPLVVLEAQAHAKAMIVSDRGGLKEFVSDGETGRVVRAGHVDDLVRAIEQVVRDPQLARSWGLRARERVAAEHSADRHYERLMAVYRAAMADRT